MTYIQFILFKLLLIMSELDYVYDVTEIVFPFVNNLLCMDVEMLKTTYEYKYFEECVMNNASFKVNATKLKIEGNVPYFGVRYDQHYIYFDNFNVLFQKLQEMLSDQQAYLLQSALVKMYNHIQIVDLEESICNMGL